MKTSNAAVLVERAVNSLLAASRSYRALPEARQRRVAGSMLRIGGYLAQPEGFSAQDLPGALAAVPAAGELVDAVDFPAFVGSLIHGVFQAIVDASIQQMEAYTDLLQSVAKTVDGFVESNVSDASGRAWLVEHFPECFKVDPATGAVRVRPGSDCALVLPRLRRLPGLATLRRLGPGALEKRVVPAARRRLAAGRQQLLAGMVLMGINRAAGS